MNVLDLSQVALVVKNPPTNAGDVRDAGLIPDQEDPLEEGMATHSQLIPHSPVLENPMDWEAWRDTVHGFAKSGIQLSN